jgi:uncharacterized protein (TIGR02231 family)
MRVLVLLALLLPMPAFAETILATSTNTAVTVYPAGAEVTREVQFDATAGAHEVLITDLPGGTDPELTRITVSDGITLGAFSVRTDRLPARPKPTSPALDAAKAVVDALRVKEQAALRVVSEVNARVEAVEAQIGFLRSVQVDMGDRTAEGLKNVGQMIAVEVLAARQAALLAQADLPAAQMALTKVQVELAQAQAAYDAVPQGDLEYVALSVDVTLQAAGAGRLVVTQYVEAGWSPVYDMTLDRKVPSLRIDRGALVAQSSGEDWVDVDLTLSTAQPFMGAEPSGVYPELRRIVSQEELDRRAKRASDDSEAGALGEPVMEPGVVEYDRGFKANPELVGDLVVYHYPTPVSLASSVDDVRLALDKIDLVPKIEARAVPRGDATAFLIASFTNGTKEILLPGLAFLLRDGILVGSIDFAKVPPGGVAEVPFGAIEGLRLKRDMPLRAEGDRGIISTTNQVEEKAVMTVENLTDEVWPVRLLDQVPYSEQEDLEITYSADPAPTEVDVDGSRGVLGWTFDVAPGETKAVRLEHLMQWPEGFVLQ